MDTIMNDPDKEKVTQAIRDAGASPDSYEKMESQIHGVRGYLSGTGLSYSLVVTDGEGKLFLVAENVSQNRRLAEEFVLRTADTLVVETNEGG